MALALYIASRLGKAVVVLFGIVILNFFVIHAAPGDPAAVMAGEAGAADEIFLKQLQEKFGLDQPLRVQLWNYLSGIARLDFGYSYRQDAPVLGLILDRLPATLLLTGTAFVVSVSLGIFAGAIAAMRVGKWADTIITTLSLLFYATPLFWVALMAVLVFSVQLNWLPAYGMVSVGVDLTGVALVFDIAAHLVLPALTLGLFFTAVYARMTRSSMLETSGMDFIKTARAKGLSSSVILRRHMLRNAILPVVTLIGLQAGQVVGGAVLTETVFAWPGIGRLMFESLLQRDYNLLLGVFLVTSAMVLVFNLLTDLAYLLIDPRIELAK